MNDTRATQPPWRRGIYQRQVVVRVHHIDVLASKQRHESRKQRRIEGRRAREPLLPEDLGERPAQRLGGEVDRSVLARTIVELITLWAVKMPWDPSPRAYPADLGPMCAGMVADLALGART